MIKEGVSIKDQLTFKERLDLGINNAEIEAVEKFCRVLGKSYAASGIESYESLHNNEDLQSLGRKLNIPYDKLIKCIYENQNYFHNLINEINE